MDIFSVIFGVLITWATTGASWLSADRQATVIAVISAFGVVQFMLQKRWRRKEFALKCLDDFRKNESVRSIINLSAWAEIIMPVFPVGYFPEQFSSTQRSGRYDKVSSHEVAELLLCEPNTQAKIRYDERQQYLLAIVDEFLLELDHLCGQVKHGLFRWSDISHGVGYFFALMRDYEYSEEKLAKEENLRCVQGRVAKLNRLKKCEVLIYGGREVDHSELAGALLLYALKWDYSNIEWALWRHNFSLKAQVRYYLRFKTRNRGSSS